MKDKTTTDTKVVISDSKYEVIYLKRIEQMKEDFPDPEVFIKK